MGTNKKSYSRRYYRAHRAKALAARKTYRTNNLDKVRDGKMRAAFGVSLARYTEMLQAQEGVCAICLKPETAIHPLSKRVRALAIDHNHETGQVRQLLCQRCNSILGYVKENPLWLRSAASYLEKHNGIS